MFLVMVNMSLCNVLGPFSESVDFWYPASIALAARSTVGTGGHFLEILTGLLYCGIEQS